MNRAGIIQDAKAIEQPQDDHDHDDYIEDLLIVACIGM